MYKVLHKNVVLINFYNPKIKFYINTRVWKTTMSNQDFGDRGVNIFKNKILLSKYLLNDFLSSYNEYF